MQLLSKGMKIKVQMTIVAILCTLTWRGLRELTSTGLDGTGAMRLQLMSGQKPGTLCGLAWAVLLISASCVLARCSCFLASWRSCFVLRCARCSACDGQTHT